MASSKTAGATGRGLSARVPGASELAAVPVGLTSRSGTPATCNSSWGGLGVAHVLAPTTRVTRPHQPTWREGRDGSRGLRLPAKLGGPPSAKLSHHPLGRRPRKGKKQDCGAGSPPDPTTLVTQMGTRGLQPLLAGANPAQGTHKRPGQSRARTRSAAQTTHDTLPTCLPGIKCPAPARRLRGKD